MSTSWPQPSSSCTPPPPPRPRSRGLVTSCACSCCCCSTFDMLSSTCSLMILPLCSMLTSMILYLGRSYSLVSAWPTYSATEHCQLYTNKFLLLEVIVSVIRDDTLFLVWSPAYLNLA